MPRLLSECPAAWKLIAVGVVPNYSLSALWTGRCRLWEARVVQPLLLWVTGAHVRSHFVQMQKKCTKGLEMKFHAVPGSYIPLIPSISWSLSTLMRLWKGLYQEVKKRVLVPLELRDQMVEALPVSWVQRNCFFLPERDLKAIQQNGHHQKTTKGELHLPIRCLFLPQGSLPGPCSYSPIATSRSGGCNVSIFLFRIRLSMGLLFHCFDFSFLSLGGGGVCSSE